MGQLGRSVAIVIVALVVIELVLPGSSARADDPPRIPIDDNSMHSTKVLQLNPAVNPNGGCTGWFASGYEPNTPEAPQSGGFNKDPLVDHHVITTALTPFANHNVQIRFTFETKDALYNHFEGWYVDNIVVKNGETVTFSDSVGTETNGWTTIGGDGTTAPGWHITTRRGTTFGGYSWWYGRESSVTYEGVPDLTEGTCDDARNSGALTSTTITLGTTPKLEFDTLWQIESVNADRFDLMQVFIEDLGLADLRVTKSATPPAGSVVAGTPITYQINVTNAGPSAATGVVVADALPVGVTVVSASAPGTCMLGGEGFTFSCALAAPLAAATSATVTAVVIPTTTGPLTNTASVSSLAHDPNLEDNSASLEHTVTASPVANGVNGAVCPHEDWLHADAVGSSGALSFQLTCSDYWLKITGGAQQLLSLRLADAPPDYRIAIFKDLPKIAKEWRDKAIAGKLEPQRLAANLSGLTGAPWDAGPWDAGPWDAGPWDAGPWDAGHGGTAPWDAGPWDAGPWDAGPWDAGSSDAAAYAVAQIIGLMAVSSTGEIVGNTWNNGGDFYIRVWSVSAAPVTEPLTVTATFTDTCAPAPNPLVKSAPSVGAVTTPKTLILTHTGRLRKDDATALTDDEVAQLLDRLNTYALRPEVAPAAVVDLKNVAGMPANYAQWDFSSGSSNNKSCIQAANIVAEAIHDVIDAYRAGVPGALQYIQIVGGDQVVPFLRMPDSAEIYGETNYNPPVLDASASRPPFGLNYLLSQDYYASFSPIAKGDHTFYPPDVGIARLVETYEDVLAAFTTYSSVNGLLPNTYLVGTTPTATDAFVAGHTFLSDLASYQVGELSASGFASTQWLIDDNSATGPLGATWSRDDFLAQFALGKRYGFLGIHSHFAANAMLAANSRAIVGSTEFAPLIAAQQTGAFVMSNGCHAGYNILKADAHSATQEKDFPQVFLRNGAGGLLASTTYAYGDTDFMGYTEDVLAKTTRRLRYGGGPSGTLPVPVIVSKAVVGAKRDHINEIVAVTGVDEKAVASLTQYGLVTYAINFPNNRLAEPVEAGLTPSPAAGDADGIATATLAPLFTVNDPIAVAIGTEGESATYLSLDDPATATVEHNVTLLPSRPVLPLFRRNVASTVTGLRPMSSVMRTADYDEASGIRALFAQALTERRNLRPYAATVGFAPSVPFGLNQRIGQTFAFTPAQYLCGVVTPPGDLCQQRKYTSGLFTIYYSNRSGLDALRGPLSIPRVSAVADLASFRAIVRVGGTDGVKELLVTYTATAGALHGHWQSKSLIGSTLSPSCDDGGATLANLASPLGAGGGFLKEYTCDINLPEDVDPRNVRFFVQAVSTGGFGSVRTGFAPSPSLTKIGTALTFLSPLVTTATYDSRRTFKVELKDVFGEPLAGRDLTIALGGVSVVATTGSDGIATSMVPINVEPRATTYDVSARFQGDAENEGRIAVQQLKVDPAPTAFVAVGSPPLSVSPLNAVTVARLEATVFDGTTERVKPLNEVPVYIRDATNASVRSTRTNASGEVIVQPDVQDLATGAISLRFEPTTRYAGATSTFGIVCDSCALNAAPTVTITSVPATPVAINTATTTAGTFTDPDSGDSHVVYWIWGDGSLTSGSLNETTHTISSDHTYANPGVYEVRAQVTDQLGATGAAAFQYIVVYDPNGGFATGGGWIMSPAGACQDTAICGTATGKASFGFVAKYKKGSDAVLGETEFQFQAGNLKFKSTSLDIKNLVISGNKAQYTGSGTINGAGDYGFKVTATDGQYKGGTSPDKFRIVIWKKNPDATRATTVYDNMLGASDTLGQGTDLSGGDIVVHTK